METALLTEHLRFTPLALLDDIINTVNEVVTRAVDAAESGLLATDPANLGFDKKRASENRRPENDSTGAPVYPEAKAEIEEGLHQLETLLESNIDRNFDKFEIYTLRGVLNVPEELVAWVRLSHYEGIQTQAGQSAELPKAEEVQRLQHRLRQTRKLNHVLETTAKKNQAALEQLTRMVGGESGHHTKTELELPLQQHGDTENNFNYAFLSNGESAKSLGVSTTDNTSITDGPLTTNTSFALSQLPALRALLDDLRPKLGEIGDASLAATEKDSVRERRIYLNNQTKKAVERQGVEIGVSADGLGRRVQLDEVAALEGIADSLAADKRNAQGGDDGMEE